MPTGTIKMYNESRGFGFLETPASREDIFFHVNDVEGPEPREGQRVEFDIQQADRGPRAVNVRPA